MSQNTHIPASESDEQASSRKKDHIELAFESQVKPDLETRFFYEPMLSPHPHSEIIKCSFAGKQLNAPIWVSSMTGGTTHAKKINHNLARVCGEFGLGMGLGSCRSLLYNDHNLDDFDVRELIGPDYPLYANLGVAQVEELILGNQTHLINRLIGNLKADGLIIHVNPSQEWLQPEGDRFLMSPLETIQQLMTLVDFPVIVKEVGQGFGYESLKALMQLPLTAIEFASHGGTNFAMLELLRGDQEKLQQYKPLVFLGHSAEEMVEWCNLLKYELKENLQCQEFIISGGVRSFLDGYYLINKLEMNSIYGQAAPFLKYAQKSYEELKQYVQYQIDGLTYAQSFLRIK